MKTFLQSTYGIVWLLFLNPFVVFVITGVYIDSVMTFEREPILSWMSVVCTTTAWLVLWWKVRECLGDFDTETAKKLFP